MLVVGLMAKNAVEKGLGVKPYIKTSLSPGSGVVTYYLNESGVTPFMEKLGYFIQNILVICATSVFKNTFLEFKVEV